MLEDKEIILNLKKLPIIQLRMLQDSVVNEDGDEVVVEDGVSINFTEYIDSRKIKKVHS
jgi:hypothetical protein